MAGKRGPPVTARRQYEKNQAGITFKAFCSGAFTVSAIRLRLQELHFPFICTIISGNYNIKGLGKVLENKPGRVW